MGEEGVSKQGHDGFWLLGFSLILGYTILYIDKVAEIIKRGEVYYTIICVIAFFWGVILIIKGRKK